MGWFGGQVLHTNHRVPGDYEVIMVGADAAGLSSVKIKPAGGSYAGLSAQAALLSLEGGDVRFRLDGGLPTSDNGHYLGSGDTLCLSGTQTLQQFRAIRAGESNVTLRVSYYY